MQKGELWHCSFKSKRLVSDVKCPVTSLESIGKTNIILTDDAVYFSDSNDNKLLKITRNYSSSNTHMIVLDDD